MANKRKHSRIPYGKEIVIRMHDNFLISGVAKDITDGGFFLKQRAHDDLSGSIGQRGVLLIDLQIETVELPCKVVRKTKDGLGIKFE
jgi:hypothetical protein